MNSDERCMVDFSQLELKKFFQLNLLVQNRHVLHQQVHGFTVAHIKLSHPQY